MGLDVKVGNTVAMEKCNALYQLLTEVHSQLSSEFQKEVRFSTTQFKDLVRLEGGPPTEVSLSIRVYSNRGLKVTCIRRCFAYPN